MQFFHDVLSWTTTAAGAHDALDLIGFDGAKVTTADAPVLGAAKHPAVAGDLASVIALGIVRVKAVGIVTVGDRLVSADGGGVKVAAEYSAGPPVVEADVNVFATALTSAPDGGFVDILIR